MLRRAGEAALARFRDATGTRKPDGTDVTDGDKAAQDVLVHALDVAFPDCGIVSEEGARKPARIRTDRDPGTWYVDPIDGTGAYLEGLAHWGPTVCLVRDGKLVEGGLWFPRLNEFWYAARGIGAYRDGVRLRPADPGPPARHHGLYLPSRFHRRQPLEWPGKVRALGSSAAHLAQAAGGGGVATLIPRWELWDVGCGILLVEEAGRLVLDGHGQPFDPITMPQRPFVAGAPSALEALTRHLGIR